MSQNKNLIEFYDNSTILITGGTGFLGKVLVEKLLRNFKIKKILLLIRSKDNVPVGERLEKYFQESIFERLRDENPKFIEQIIAIESDFNSHDLNISVEDMKMIVDEVDIVFNIVASVKFNEKFKDAFDINVLGTKKILNLIVQMKNLKSFVHISTLYSNCNLKYIEEKIYEPQIDYEKMIEMSRILNANDFENLYHCMIGEMPNTYTMTKKCSENLVYFKAHHLPAGIFRPPIVLSTYKEPVPGWTDNLNGPSGVCTMSAKGFVHCIYGHGSLKANLVPADYCINAIIASAWDINRRYDERQQKYTPIPVYNYMYDKNNITWGQYMQLSKNGYKSPMEGSYWCFSYMIIRQKHLFACAEFILHTLPGYILDLIALITGQKRIYAKGYEKMKRVLQLLSYFGLREWSFQNDNVKNLSKIVNETDEANKLNLQFDIETIDWKEYFSYYMFGIKKYYFKENFEKLDKLQKRYKRFCVYHAIVKFIFWIAITSLSTKLVWNFFKTKIINVF